MRRIWFPALLISCAFAQNPSDLFNQAPPAVDQALRQRITEFYQDHIDGKFRAAEKLVAEDTKEFFYVSNKPKYLSCAIDKVTYSDEFSKAKAVVICETFVPVPGFLDKPLKVPIPSRWKVEGGQWCWYVDQEELKMTPFGKMKAGPDSKGAGSPLPDIASMDTKAMMYRVKAARTVVKLKSGEESSDHVDITNGMSGPASLSLATPKVAAFQASLDKAELQAGEKAVLSVSWNGSEKPPKKLSVIVRVRQTGQAIPVSVSFTP